MSDLPNVRMTDAPTRTAHALVIASLLPAIAAVALYLPTVRCGFVWDDIYFVRENTAVQSWSSLPRFFHDRTSYYAGFAPPREYVPVFRPVRNISYVIDHTVWHLRPAGYHLHNAILHGIVVALVFAFLVQIAGSRGAAFAGSMVFAFHPVLTETVCWVKARDVLLCSAFGMASIVLLFSGMRRGLGGIRIVSSVCLYGLSLFSYQVAVGFVAVGMLGLLVVRQEGRVLPMRHLARWLLGVLFVTALFVVWSHAVFGRTTMAPYPVEGRFVPTMITMAAAVTDYARLLIFPWRLNADYDNYPRYLSLTALPVLAGLCLLVGLACTVAVLWHRGDRRTACGILWVVAFLLPVANIVPTMQILAERFLYLPAIGLAIVVASAFSRVGPGNRLLAVCVVGGVVLLCGLRVQMRIVDWRDELSLFRSCYRADSKNCRAARNYGLQLYEARRCAEALPVLEDYVSRCAPDADAFYGLAFCCNACGRPADALSLLETACGQFPSSADLWVLHAIVASERGFAKEAGAAADRARTMPIVDPRLEYNLGRVYENVGRTTEAREILDRVGPIVGKGTARTSATASPK